MFILNRFYSYFLFSFGLRRYFLFFGSLYLWHNTRNTRKTIKKKDGKENSMINCLLTFTTQFEKGVDKIWYHCLFRALLNSEKYKYYLVNWFSISLLCVHKFHGRLCLQFNANEEARLDSLWWNKNMSKILWFYI